MFHQSLSMALAVAMLFGAIQGVTAATCSQANKESITSPCITNINHAINVMINDASLETYNGDAYTIQQQNSGSNSHASEALYDIFNNCIENYYESGTWDLDGQWYWIQLYSGCIV